MATAAASPWQRAAAVRGPPVDLLGRTKETAKEKRKKNERKKKKQERIEAKQQKDAMSDAAHLRRRRQVLLRTVDSVFFG